MKAIQRILAHERTVPLLMIVLGVLFAVMAGAAFYLLHLLDRCG